MEYDVQKTPKHDAMCLWLMEQIKILEVLPFELEKQFKTVHITGGGWCKNVACELFKTKTLLESPLKSNSNHIGGYIDILVNCEYKPIDENIAKKSVGRNGVSKIIEVKPYIKSVGDVVRQINRYKEYSRMQGYNGERLNKHISYGNDEYYLFTFDKRFDKQIESQDITVLHPYPDVTIEDMINEFNL